ncbi:TetR/AcrR family transcriptional regulator [Rhodococcus sp. T2V]|uniref:TetR/AcrR family transcriptional regulator n=1 Tax=Rhodococcus sp. T2V TaxID=3034164 RepID=UPI0023E1AE92|nr:TetR/AcrR family transcriptional regulator [Rhodococcus sp. T2V]MDF3304659.1 TetR/AcrR family transcriptional regulator [Rhodococcus sp. T2V]
MDSAPRMTRQAPSPSGRSQRRGVERRRAILDAAEAILCEQGYAAATLKAVGERAGIPTASMYHYFPDRHEVEIELLTNHLRELDKQVSAALTTARIRALHDAADAIIDPELAYFRQHPACAELWFAGRNESMTELVQAFDDEKAHALWSLLIDQGLLRADTPLLVLQLAFEAGNRLFDVAFRRSPGGDDDTITEARRLFNAYLATYAPEA